MNVSGLRRFNFRRIASVIALGPFRNPKLRIPKCRRSPTIARERQSTTSDLPVTKGRFPAASSFAVRCWMFDVRVCIPSPAIRIPNSAILCPTRITDHPLPIYSFLLNFPKRLWRSPGVHKRSEIRSDLEKKKSKTGRRGRRYL